MQQQSGGAARVVGIPLLAFSSVLLGKAQDGRMCGITIQTDE